MDPIYPRFARAHSRFYDFPSKQVEAEVVFEPSSNCSWSEWVASTNEAWSFWKHPSTEIVDQGWKIHVSTTMDVAQEILTRVSGFCSANRFAFKFLRDSTRLTAALSKDADRAQSGKFITIYPPTVQELQYALTQLEELVGGFPGPYILSDLRWQSGPLHVR